MSPATGSVALDTSAQVPYVMLSQPAHLLTRGQIAGRTAKLTTHSLAETYSVLTRLPGDARMKPADPAALLAAISRTRSHRAWTSAATLPSVLAPVGIAGGAVYDALVGPAEQAAGVVLITRDARAIPTYTAVGATIEIAG